MPENDKMPLWSINIKAMFYLAAERKNGKMDGQPE
jgi:hypothetical protein